MPEHDEKGTGKHPHKSSEEPYPHHDGRGSGKQNAGSGSESHGSREGESREGESGDLKKREYRDEKGEIHHHTRTYEEQHK